MKNKSTGIIRNLLIVFALSAVVLTISIAASIACINQLIEGNKLVSHTYEVLGKAESMISYLKDGETAQRGYMLAGNKEFLEPYNMAFQKAKRTLNELKLLTADNPKQQQRLAEYAVLIDERFKQTEGVLLRYNTNLPVGEQQLLIGKRTMDEIRQLTNEIKSDEEKLLAERTETVTLYARYTPLSIIFAALISVGITVSSFVRIRKDITDRIKKQEEDEALYKETAERISIIESATKRISEGELQTRIEDHKTDELGKISTALNAMTASLQKTFSELEIKNWLQSKNVEINDSIRGEMNISILGESILQILSSILKFEVGTLYTSHAGHYVLAASHGAHHAPKELTQGEGVISKVIKSKKTLQLNDLSPSHLHVVSSTGNSETIHIIIAPLLFNKEVVAVVEMAFSHKPLPFELELIENCIETLGIAINSALSYSKLQELLEETQAQSEELQSQHTEMENLNAELEAQAHKLQVSEEELKVQQEELLQANAELEENSVLLAEKNSALEIKTRDLIQTTKYKTEFLANMSHELRTPLNSILLLSRLLVDNNNKHLDEEEIEYAKVIQSSGSGLLNLINEILDLSQIETGKMDLVFEPANVQSIFDDLKGLFNPLAKEKGIEFKLSMQDDVPKNIITDRMRLDQILKNLISNAIKFTDKGYVSISVGMMSNQDNVLYFKVKDTGIGIAADKHQLIFNAFQQADGSTKRKFGGTGLGLSISKELAKLLNGNITLDSTAGKGSEFTLIIPVSPAHQVIQVEAPVNTPIPKEQHTQHEAYLSSVIPVALEDDRATIAAGDKCLLVVEDDMNYAKILFDFARDKKYKVVLTVRGDEALPLAKQYQPQGVLLDIQLPIKSGWEVLDELKADPLTKHIPVHIISSHSVKRESLRKGAVDFARKPVDYSEMHEVFEKLEHVLTKHPKKVLIVEDNTQHAKALSYFLGHNNIQSEIKNNIHESMNALKSKEIDCVILDMGIPGKNAYEALEELKKDPNFEALPVIVFTGKSLSVNEENRIKKYADSIIVKTAYSYQRMLDEVSLFLHLVEKNKIQGTEGFFKRVNTRDQALQGKTVLVTDDDIRNIFSLTKALESVQLNVITAVNGKEALQKMKENSSIDIVLLDIMMPEMDGYETARNIRANPAWKNLPIIAVTAKAMSGDREKCINAGASDYISKPIDSDQLLSLLRVWLYDSKN